jgi:outer membrane receptor protein involved in Fe transport
MSKSNCWVIGADIAGALTSLILSTNSPAQSSGPGANVGLEEIVVTAERRSQRLEDVPISVAAFSQEKLDSQGVRSIDDIARLTPGLNFQRNGGSANNYNGESSEIAIRGIQSSAGPQTTGIYIDDTPIQGRHLQFSTVNPFPALFDLDRVEVLRGPQGTLFGAGSEGGTVRFITPEPGLHQYSGYARSELAYTKGGAPSYEVGAAVGGPISDGRVGFRFSASYRKDGGWVDRVNWNLDGQGKPVIAGVADKNSNWQETYVARAALIFAPTENLKITPSLYFQEVYLHDTGDYWAPLSDGSNGVFRNGNRISNQSSDPFILSAVKIDWNLGAVRLISNTSYFSREQHAVTDYSSFDRIIFTGDPYTPAGIPADAHFTDTQNNFIQELRLQSTATDTKLNWSAGLFYGHQRENTTQFSHDPTLEGDLLGATGTDFGPLLPGDYLYVQTPFQSIDTQYALFGEGDYELAPGLKLKAGVRFAHINFQGNAFYEYPVQILGPSVTTNASSSEDPVTPRLGFTYQPNPNSLYYATAAKGYRIGGINTQLPSPCNAELSALGYNAGVPGKYNSDSVWSYELGLKDSLWERRVQIDASIYWINWNGIQQNFYLPSCGFQFTANLGKVVSKGGDIDIRARLTENLTTGLTVGYSDAVYQQTITGSAANVITSGDHLPAAPWTIAASGEYVLPISRSDGGRPYARLDYQLSIAQHSATQTQDPANVIYDAGIPLTPQVKSLSLRAGYRIAGWDLSLFGNNLTNTHPLLFRSHDLVSSPLYFDYSSRPRTVGLTATYRY